MMFYNDLSTYTSDNILRNSPNTAHSGPELAPKTIHAENLAREVVLDKINLITSDRPSWTTAGEPAHSLRMKF